MRNRTRQCLMLIGPLLLSAGCQRPQSAEAQAPTVGAENKAVATIRSGRVLHADDLKALTWRSVGPANMGGRVADIAIAPGNAKTFYVGFATGGLFKTVNNGTTFTPVFDDQATASIGSVVVVDAPPDWPGWADLEDEGEDAEEKDPAERGKARIVWVGTGEGNGRNSSSWGNGVYRSTDGGGTFTHLGLADSHDIPRLAVDPRNPDVCYVAALGHLWGANEERGVYKTADGGKTWARVLYIDENTGACDVLIDPANPDTVYAAMYMRRRTAHSFQSGGPNGGIYRSDDGGANFEKLTNGLPPQTGRIGLDIYQKDPRILYAVVESDHGGSGPTAFSDKSKSGGVFRTDDRGETWTRVNELAPRAFYFSRIRIDPANDQRIYLLGWGLSISDDGGKHFRAGGARKPHVDMHAFVIDPADTDHLLLGSDGGIYISYDRAESWDFLNHLAVGQFYNVAVDLSDPYRIGGGLQDNGTWIGPSATLRESGRDALGEEGTAITNEEWMFINNGDGFHVAFHPEDPNIVFCESQGGELVRVHLDSGVRKRLKPAAKEGEPRLRYNWNSPFFISPHDPDVLYLGGNCVFKFTDRGDRWERISGDLSTRDLEKIITVGSDAETHGTVVSLAESPLRKGMLWAGTDDGLIHRTTDDGKNWSNVTPLLVAGRYISKIEPSHHDADTAYAAVDGHRSDRMFPLVMMTTDGGENWESITGDLPGTSPVKVVREDVNNPNVLYAGTEQAAYVSLDRGAHWVKLNGKSLPTVAVDDLAIQPREMDLVAGTHGRSIYVLDDISPLSQLTPEVLNADLHLFDIADGKPKLFLPYGGLWGDRMFMAANPPMGAAITYWLRDYTGEDVSVTITDANGYTARKLNGTNRAGLNRVVWDLQYEKYDKHRSTDSFLRQTQFVPPGEYTALVMIGKKKESKKFRVLPPPGTPQ